MLGFQWNKVPIKYYGSIYNYDNRL